MGWGPLFTLLKPCHIPAMFKQYRSYTQIGLFKGKQVAEFAPVLASCSPYTAELRLGREKQYKDQISCTAMLMYQQEHADRRRVTKTPAHQCVFPFTVQAQPGEGTRPGWCYAGHTVCVIYIYILRK